MVTETPTVLADLDQFNDISGRKESEAQLLALIDDDESTIDDLARIASTDPILASKIMRLANSSYYGMSTMVSDLRFAISILGATTLRSLAISSLAHSLFSVPASHWQKSLHLAGSASAISPNFGCETSRAICAGLLADVGELAIMKCDPFGYLELRSQLQQVDPSVLGETILRLERERYGLDHSTIGARLVLGWNFPSDIVSAVADHHGKDVTAPLNRTIATAQIFDTFRRARRSNPVAIPKELHGLDLIQLEVEVDEFLSVMLGL